jgi:aldehyde:ferredoxin oxidoreductase
MGSKKLKAIAVRGELPINTFDEVSLKKLSKKITERLKKSPGAVQLGQLGTIRLVKGFNKAGWLPTRNWTGDGSQKKWENLWAESLNKKYLKKYSSCYGCPIHCKRVVEFENEKFEINPIFGGPEYETTAALGSLCDIYDLGYVAKGAELCNKYTMDSISTGSAIAFAMHCFKKGILTKKDTYGINLKFGNKEAMLEMIKKIAFREEGLGDLLAEGTLRASKRIGKGSDKFIRQVKGQEIPMHDPRVKVGVGLQYALSTYGADHMKAPHDTYFQSFDSTGIKEMASLGFLEPLAVNDISKKKVKQFKLGELLVSLYDTLNLCDFTFIPFNLGGKMEELLLIINYITGWETSWYELLKVSERSINMAQVFNLREGFSPKDDTIPDIFYKDFEDGILKGTGAIEKKAFSDAVKYRYQIMGWDPITGEPSKGKLMDLDLDWLIRY